MHLHPGSPEAAKEGCTCSAMTNRNGDGVYIKENGEPEFWIKPSCPLHDAAGVMK